MDKIEITEIILKLKEQIYMIYEIINITFDPNFINILEKICISTIKKIKKNNEYSDILIINLLEIIMLADDEHLFEKINYLLQNDCNILISDKFEDTFNKRIFKNISKCKINIANKQLELGKNDENFLKFICLGFFDLHIYDHNYDEKNYEKFLKNIKYNFDLKKFFETTLEDNSPCPFINFMSGIVRFENINIFIDIIENHNPYCQHDIFSLLINYEVMHPNTFCYIAEKFKLMVKKPLITNSQIKKMLLKSCELNLSENIMKIFNIIKKDDIFYNYKFYDDLLTTIILSGNFEVYNLLKDLLPMFDDIYNYIKKLLSGYTTFQFYNYVNINRLNITQQSFDTLISVLNYLVNKERINEYYNLFQNIIFLLFSTDNILLFMKFINEYYTKVTEITEEVLYEIIDKMLTGSPFYILGNFFPKLYLSVNISNRIIMLKKLIDCYKTLLSSNYDEYEDKFIYASFEKYFDKHVVDYLYENDLLL